jgi:hypothetical protein
VLGLDASPADEVTIRSGKVTRATWRRRAPLRESRDAAR